MQSTSSDASYLFKLFRADASVPVRVNGLCFSIDLWKETTGNADAE